MAAPVAQPLDLTGDEDTPILTTLAATDADSDPFDFFEIVDAPTNGVVVPVADGGIEEYVYLPNANYFGSDSFTYRVFANGEYSAVATVTLAVNSVADAPVLDEGMAPSSLVFGGVNSGIETAVASLNSGMARVEVWHGFNQAGDTDGILFQVYDAGGVPGFNGRVNTTTANTQSDPSVVTLNDNSFVVTWTSDAQDGDAGGIYAQHFLPSGTTIGGEIRINSTTVGHQSESDVAALKDGGFVVAWSSDDGTGSHVFLQRYDASNGTVGGEVAVDTLPSFQGFDPAATTLNNGDVVVTWTAYDQDTANFDIYAQIYGLAGQTLGSSFRINGNVTGDQTDGDVVALGSGGFAAAFVDNNLGTYSVGIHKFAQNGTPAPGETLISTNGADFVDNVAMTATLDGGFVVAWQEMHGSKVHVMMQRLDAAANALSGPVEITSGNTDSRLTPSLAQLQNGNLLALYTEDPTAPGDNLVMDQLFSLPTKQDVLGEGSTRSGILPNALLTDADTPDLTSVTVQVKGGYRVGDDLYVNTAATGITQVFDTESKVLTLSGIAPTADYESVLRTLSFHAANGGDGTRALEIVATSSDGTSTPLLLNLKVNTINQYLIGNAAANNFIGGNGFDTFTGGGGHDSLTGNDSNDSLKGGNGNDLLDGGNGDDTLDGNYGNDTLFGGAGNDTYGVSSNADVVIEFEGGGADIVHASATYTLANNVEQLVLVGTADISGTGSSTDNLIKGNAGNNGLFGGGGNDVLRGRNGNDSLTGESGFDTLYGGHGDDTYYVDADDVISEIGGSGIDTIVADMSWGLGFDFENLTFAGTGDYKGWGNTKDNVLYGNSGNNSLSGSDGKDTLYGGDGNDTLIAGSGTDELSGGAGNDVYYIDNYLDQVIEDASSGFDTVYAASDYNLAANVENLVFQGAVSRFGSGNNLANKITGTANADTIYGAVGNDTLIGGDGGDFLDGGTGSDYLRGDNGFDFLTGGDGYDWLFGGADTDILTGGNGLDAFVFDTAIDGSSNIDSISDFGSGVDTLRLDDAVFAGLTTGALSAGEFTLGTAATDAVQRIIYDQATGSLYYDADGVGATAQLLFAVLSNNGNLAASDIFVI